MTRAPVEEAALPFPLTSTTFELTAQRIADYADAIGDPNPAFRRGDRDDSHLVAAPTLASAFMQDPIRDLFADAARLERLGVDGSRVVFGEVEYEFARTLRPGDWLRVEGELVNRETKGAREILTFLTRAVLDDGTTATSATITFVRL